MTPTLRPTRIAVMILALIVPTLAGCGGGEEVTARAIRDARRTWTQAKVPDYNLEWTSSGLRNAHYRVYVRGGRVREVHALIPGNRTIKQKPADAEAYGVDGLFQIIEEELDQLNTAEPFGQPKGTKAVLRFTPDPKLGYPRTYRRDVLGSPQAIAIDVIRLVPNPTEPIPSPSG